jgi:dTMP kinase
MGKLIVLEGLDGSGKGTQTGLLKEYLEQTGHKVRVIDFPDYKSEGSVLVRMYLGGELGERPSDTNAFAASMFFAADRYVSFVTGWREAYEDEDTIVIANRYTTANAYHQLSKMDEAEWEGFLEWLWDFEFEKLGLPAPDRVILLDMPESVSSAMVAKRSRETGQKLDIHEKSEDYLIKCRTAAAYTAEKCGWRVVKCANEGDTTPYSREEIAKMVQECISDLI